MYNLSRMYSTLKNLQCSTYLVQPQVPVFDVVTLGDLRVKRRSLSLELEDSHARVMTCKKQRGGERRRRREVEVAKRRGGREVEVVSEQRESVLK
jgi:hypothetical protein